MLGLGLGITRHTPAGGGAGLPAFALEAETQRIVSAFTAANGGTAPTAGTQYAINKVVKVLKAQGVYADAAAGKKCVFATTQLAANKAQSLINWIDPTGLVYGLPAALTENGTVSFAQGYNAGWSGFTATNRLKTGITLNQIAQNSVFMGVHAVGGINTNVDAGAQDSALNGLLINAGYTGSNLVTRCMGQVLTSTENGYFNGSGWAAVNRTSSTGFEGYHHGVRINSYTNASAAITETPEICVGKATNNSTTSSRTISTFLLCGGKTQAQAEALGVIITDLNGPMADGQPTVYEAGTQPASVSADIIVYGLTMQAVIAAYAAKRRNPAQTVIIVGDEYQNHLWRLGGMLAQNLTYADINYTIGGGNKYISGVIRDVMDYINTNRYSRSTGTTPSQTTASIEPRFWNGLARRLLDPSKTGTLPGVDVPIYFSGGMSAVTTTPSGLGGKPAVTGFTTHDGRTFSCSALIGADYLGVPVPLIGIPYRIGQEPDGSGSESTSGYRNPNRLPVFGAAFPGVAGSTTVTVDPYVTPGDAGSGLIPNVIAPPALSVGAADSALQPMNKRVPMTSAKGQYAPVWSTPPSGYDVMNYEFVGRAYAAATAAGTAPTRNDTFSFGATGGGATYDLNNGSSRVGSDMPNSGVLLAATTTREERKAVLDAVDQYVSGYLYWHAHSGDSRIPSARVADFGTNFFFDARQFLECESDGKLYWPDQVYIRQPLYQMKNAGFMFLASDTAAADGTTPRSTKIIACHSYPWDGHSLRICAYDDGSGTRIMDQGSVSGGGAGSTDGVVPTPLEAFVPDASVCGNYATPTHPSFSSRAWCSYRMEFAMCVAAESLGIIMSMALDANTDPLSLTYGDTTTAGTIAYNLTHAGDTATLYLQTVN